MGDGGSTPPPAVIKGDINKSGKVDIFDFNVLMVQWGGAGSSAADLNSDSKVDIFDFNILMINWSL